MISIITPVLNEEKNVRPFLSHIDSLDGDFELILVDGGSGDRTVEEIRKRKDSFNRTITILETCRGRGAQMRGKHNPLGRLLERFSADVTRWTGGTSAFAGSLDLSVYYGLTNTIHLGGRLRSYDVDGFVVGIIIGTELDALGRLKRCGSARSENSLLPRTNPFARGASGRIARARRCPPKDRQRYNAPY